MPAWRGNRWSGWTGGAAVVALLVAAGAMATPVPAFTATDLTSGTRAVCRAAGADNRLALAFTHSMYGGRVVEEYVATRSGELRRTSVTTENAAAAEYYAYYGATTRDGKHFRVVTPAEEFAQLVVRVDRVGDQGLTVSGEEIDLLAATGVGHQVRLAVEPVTFGRRLLGAC